MKSWEKPILKRKSRIVLHLAKGKNAFDFFISLSLFYLKLQNNKHTLMHLFIILPNIEMLECFKYLKIVK